MRIPPARVCIDRFDTTLDIPPRRRTYAAIKARVLDAGRFSIFEATASARDARLFTLLHRDPELVCVARGYPWIYVTRTEVPRG